MIKTTYDPIMGVRYEIVDGDIRTESQRITQTKALEKFNRTRHKRDKELRRRTNTKQK